jgi:Protein of unknown function (DUF433)
MRAGCPAIKGISTEAIWEHEQADETVSGIAADFDLTEDDVRWALAYETSARAACASGRGQPASATTSTPIGKNRSYRVNAVSPPIRPKQSRTS